jgi:hypothetical protein
MSHVTDCGVIDTVEVTPPAVADAVTGAKPDDTDRKIQKFTASRPEGGLICTDNTAKGADDNACRAKVNRSTPAPPGWPDGTISV